MIVCDFCKLIIAPSMFHCYIHNVKAPLTVLETTNATRFIGIDGRACVIDNISKLNENNSRKKEE